MKRICLIDDDIEYGTIFKHHLEEQGYSVTVIDKKLDVTAQKLREQDFIFVDHSLYWLGDRERFDEGGEMIEQYQRFTSAWFALISTDPSTAFTNSNLNRISKGVITRILPKNGSIGKYPVDGLSDILRELEHNKCIFKYINNEEAQYAQN